jgi:DnaJ-class molecular chaperone
MPTNKNYYQILGVPDSASSEEIKKSYRGLAKQYHPDANPNDPTAAERFKEVSEAYATLNDAEKRKKYDTMRKYGAFAGAGSGFRTRTSSDSSPLDDLDFSNLGGLGGLRSNRSRLWWKCRSARRLSAARSM